MALQKSPPHGPPIVDSQVVNHRQLQERRRTLQTISELSATDTTLPNLLTTIGNEQMALAGRAGFSSSGQKNSNFSKRRSLPQYCARPEYAPTRSPPTVPSRHITSAQRLQPGNNLVTAPTPRQESGWNARRERARLQAEEALSGVNMRQHSSSSVNIGSSSTLPTVSPRPKNNPSQLHLWSHHSKQHLLRNSRSMTGAPSIPEQRSGLRGSSAYTIPHNHDTAPSEPTSIDSSSFLSSHENSVRRSRSSSSSQSFTLHDVPPLPTGCAQPTQSYYTALTSHHHTGYPIQLPEPMYAKAPSKIQISSFPSMRLQSNVLSHAYYANISPAPQPKEQYNHVQRARPKSLSAPTTSGLQQPLDRHTSRSSVTSQGSRPSTKKPRPASSTHLPPPTKRRPRPRSNSGLKPPPQTQPRMNACADPKPGLTSPPEKRSMPDRESLTNSKSEREQAKAKFDGIHRAKIKERVRRANEMEQEKEKQLQALGKGAEKGARVLGKGLKREERRGCLGGWLGRVVGRVF